MNRKVSYILVLICVLFFCASPSAFGAKDEDLSGFLNATYGLIGKKPGSSETYSGSVAIRPHGDGIEVVRCVGTSRITGKASIVPVTSDRIPNLKVEWRDGKDRYEAFYMIHSDADNYARLSGPYVRLTDRAKFGWELLYVDPHGAPVCK